MNYFHHKQLGSNALYSFLALGTGLLTGCAQAQPTGDEPTATTAVNPAQVSQVARQSESGAPYINTWLLLGAFDNDAKNSGYNRDAIGETAVQPQEGQDVAGQKWRYFDDRLFSRNYDDYNDLYSYFSVRQKASAVAKVVYAHSYVYSPRAQSLQLRLGADTAVKAWVNGILVAADVVAGPVNVVEGEKKHLSGGRDYVVVATQLNAGWNRLLLKIANKEDGRFGFYARFTTDAGEAPTGLIYSTGGGSGALAIENSAMPEAKTGALPVAYREWSYIEAQPDVKKLLEMGKVKSGPNGQQPADIPGMGIGFTYNVGLGMKASAFKLSARGGQAPYTWTKTTGSLPSGLKVESDGTLHGTPSVNTKEGVYKFAVQVRDASGKTASREYSLNLKERPNRRIESQRLLALIHGPELVPAADVPKMARQMKREGYSLGVPITFNNGDQLFRWPSSFGKKQTATDVVASYKKSLEAEGLEFGMYMGNLNLTGGTEFSVNQQNLMVREAIEKYHPKALWFDWLGLDGSTLDSLFSTIKSVDPDIVIILNGSERLSNGDWDIITYEGWGAWGSASWHTWPALFPWPKKNTPSSWRLSVEPTWEVGQGLTTDWREMLRVQLSLIGEGYIADIDHTSSLGPKKDTPFETWPLVVQHGHMGDWASPKGLPPLYEAYTNVDPGPLKAASWGYNTINLKRDTIYLLTIKNPHGRTGLPAKKKINVGAIPVKVKSITLMNSNAPLKFSQAAGGLTIDTQNIKQDEIASVIKIVFQKPLTAQQAAVPIASLAVNSIKPPPTPEGNIATSKPAWLMSADNSHELTASSGAMAIYGVDGDLKSLSVGAYEYAWSYKVDLQREATIRRIVVVFTEKLWATQYKILVSSDDKTWKAVVEIDKGEPGEHSYKLDGVKARYVRVQSLKPDGPGQPGSQMAIAELQVFEK